MKSPLTTNPLWEATRDMHHACEHHPVGAAMASGQPPRQWYAAWLTALRQIHEVVDAGLPESLHRVTRLEADIAAMGLPTPPLNAAAQYAAQLNTKGALAGAAYVLTGAHLMGGEIMRRRLENFPTEHLTWDDRKQALGELNKLRAAEGITQESRDCFKALLNIMDEIALTWP
jgi:heme oxygenase